MMELYFPPFAAVANKTAGYMCTFCAAADPYSKLVFLFLLFFFYVCRLSNLTAAPCASRNDALASSGSYNRINGAYACENPECLREP